ncbi:MAG: hypothetical protein JSV45_00685 [Chromatiales bacterium]|nr:MAG: hypothetical protein JSV45_00685 [Chromatiales bacterium]
MRAPLIILSLLVVGAAPAGALELPWAQAEYKARKMFMTIRLDMGLQLLSGDAARAATPPPFQGEGVPLQGDTAGLVTLRSRRSGQTKQTQLYLDPADGAALLREQREWSDNPDFKSLRYTTTGIARTRSEPLPGEADKPPSEWGQVREQFRAFPKLDEGTVVSDAAFLPFLIATRDWRGPSEKIEFLVFEDQQLVRISATAVRWNIHRVDYQTDDGDVDGKEKLLEVRIVALSADSSGTADIDLFGLSSDVLVLVDTRLGVPVEIRGSVPFLGEVRFALKRVTQKPAAN